MESLLVGMSSIHHRSCPKINTHALNFIKTWNTAFIQKFSNHSHYQNQHLLCLLSFDHIFIIQGKKKNKQKNKNVIMSKKMEQLYCMSSIVSQQFSQALVCQFTEQSIFQNM